MEKFVRAFASCWTSICAKSNFVNSAPALPNFHPVREPRHFVNILMNEC